MTSLSQRLSKAREQLREAQNAVFWLEQEVANRQADLKVGDTVYISGEIIEQGSNADYLVRFELDGVPDYSRLVRVVDLAEPYKDTESFECLDSLAEAKLGETIWVAAVVTKPVGYGWVDAIEVEVENETVVLEYANSLWRRKEK